MCTSMARTAAWRTGIPKMTRFNHFKDKPVWKGLGETEREREGTMQMFME